MIIMEKKESILIIAPSMVPCITSWGGSQRMYYLANTLAANGVNVIAVAPKYQLADCLDEKKVLYKPLFLGEETNGNLTKPVSCMDKQKKRIIEEKLTRAKTFIYMRRVNWDRFWYNEPSSFEGKKHKKWLEKNKNIILNIIIKKKIKKVIISGPSFSLFKIAKSIKRIDKNIKVIFDYRDPWHLWNCKKNAAYLKEKEYLKYADMVICFSGPFQKDFCKTFHIEQEKTAVVYNGYSENDWSKVKVHENNKGNKLIITYTGSMDFNDNKLNYRNPNRIIEAVRKIPSELIELRFVGVNDAHKKKDCENIKYIGKVSQQESFSYMQESDVLLNIHDTDDCSGKYLISGKFYDYMRSGKVIWNVGKDESLASILIEKHRLGINCKNEVKDIEDVLEKLLDYKRKKQIEKMRNSLQGNIYEFSREEQNKKYFSLIFNQNST